MCFLLLALLGLGGCANPKLQQDLNNQNGRIDQIENLQNSMKNDILTLRQQNEINGSTLDKVQNGLLNLQGNTAFNGIQILSGTGGLVVGLVGFVILCGGVYFYRREALQNAKAADIMAKKIAQQADPALTDEVFKAAMFSDVEAKVCHLMKRAQVTP